MTEAVSAKGLFRATGKARKKRLVHLGGGTFGTTTDRARAADDFEPTPPEPTLALLRAEATHLKRFPTIWEAACGDGRMARDIASCGYDVVTSDLRDRGCGAVIRDYFEFASPMAPCVITNPPYDQVNSRNGGGRWIWHGLDTLGLDYMALLLSWSWPGAADHARLWRRHTPSIVYLCRWRIDFSGEGAAPMLNGWFVWDRTRPPPEPGVTRFAMLDRCATPNQSELFGGLK